MIPALAGKRVALVHDWLTGMRGGEHVLAAITRLLPASPDLLTLVHVPGTVSAELEARHIRPSWINHLPWPSRAYRHYLPLFPAAIEHFDLDDVDVVISTSHCAAKAVVPTGRAVHLCYSHSPMRYGWDQFDSYFGTERLGRAGTWAARHTLAALARWDRATTPRVTRFLANSAHVAGRIARYYNRVATVLPPPVDTGWFTPGSDEPGRHFVVVSALVPYKRIDTAITAAAMLGVPLTIIGTGPDDARLRALAGPDVTFLGRVSAETLREAYRSAHAFLMPGEEDFGMAPVESLACGRPVVALARGGACETVEHGVTGWLVEDDSAQALAEAMSRVDTLPTTPADRRRHALRYSPDRFEDGFARHLSDTLAAPHTW